MAVCGPGKCGKDTVCEWLRDNTSLIYTGSTSLYACKEVMEHMKDVGIDYDTPQMCYDDRDNHRQIWADVINDMNKENKTKLYARCLNEQHILNGIRNQEEFIACRSSGIIDLSIWIDRDVPNDPTMGYGSELCDIVIENKMDLISLFSRLTRLSKALDIMR